MLTAHLLEPTEWTKSDLDRLEEGLQLGKAHCTDFQLIFQERELPKDATIDGEIINILAEVKAFEFLHKHGFRDIIKLRREQDAKTVDFTAKRNKQIYAVEVTRLGLAQADRKKPRHMVEDNLIRHTISGENKLVSECVGKWFLTSGKENIPRIIETIRDAINSKYPQIKEFCQIQGGDWNGMLIISTGRDYFIMNKYAKTEFEMTQNAVEKALREVWNLRRYEQGEHKYLHHVVVTMTKDLSQAIIYPRL
jgi:hypothetical protein